MTSLLSVCMKHDEVRHVFLLEYFYYLCMMKKGAFIGVAAVIITIIAIVCVVVAVPAYKYRFSEAVTKEGNLKIYPGTTLEQVAEQLQAEGYIKSAAKMIQFARSHERDSLQTGNYQLDKGSSYRSLLNKLSSGRQLPIRLTFNNFRTVERLIGAVARKTLADSASMMAVMTNDSLMRSKGFTHQTLISMFIPNTYEVYWTITPEQFFNKMYSEYDEFWNKNRRALASELGFTPAQIATIASIVDAETNKEAEMSNVAGVYINRISRRMPLQADPTVKFALQDFGLKRILNKHLEVDSPYNTYKNQGLPPGPICMPSIAAVDATLHYAGHNYLYFCAKADFSGYHTFATNLSQHNRNAKAYQAELNKRKIR